MMPSTYFDSTDYVKRRMIESRNHSGFCFLHPDSRVYYIKRQNVDIARSLLEKVAGLNPGYPCRCAIVKGPFPTKGDDGEFAINIMHSLMIRLFNWSRKIAAADFHNVAGCPFDEWSGISDVKVAEESVFM